MSRKPIAKNDDYESLVEAVIARTQHIVERVSKQHADKVVDASVDTTDFEQAVYLWLAEWVRENHHETVAMLAAPEYIERFMQRSARFRCLDFAEKLYADKRAAGRTIHASHSYGDPDEGGEVLLDIMAARLLPAPDPSGGLEAAEALLHRLSSLAKDLLGAVLDGPEHLRRGIRAITERSSAGSARLRNATVKHGTSKLELHTTEGYYQGAKSITWEGPLRTGRLQTSIGMATVVDETDVWRMDLETGPTIYLDGSDGVWEAKTIQPSAKQFDPKAMSVYLEEKTGRRVGVITVEKAWTEVLVSAKLLSA